MGDVKMAEETKKVLDELWLEAFTPSQKGVMQCTRPNTPENTEAATRPAIVREESFPRSLDVVSPADRLERTVLRTWRGSAWAPFAPQRGLSQSFSSGCLDPSPLGVQMEPVERPNTAPGNSRSMLESLANALDDALPAEHQHSSMHHAPLTSDADRPHTAPCGQDKHRTRSLSTTSAISPYAVLIRPPS